MVDAWLSAWLVVEQEGMFLPLSWAPCYFITDKLTLLSNRQIMPWDSDVDVQVTERSMHYLASYYNMTIFYYNPASSEEARGYLLEVNPHYVIRDASDWKNVIDARWIDMTTGLFIDITTVRYDENHPGGNHVLTCKDGHQYQASYSISY